MSNPANNSNLIGRLAGDPKIFENKDGSKKVLFTLYADRNYLNSKGERDSDALPLEAFVPAKVNGVGPYSNIHKGDLVAVGSTLRMDTYQDASGKTVYKLKVIAEDIRFLESRSVTSARLNTRIEAAQNALQAAQAQSQAAATPAAAPAAAVQATPASDQAQFAAAMNQAPAAEQYLPYGG